jgi:hypothetical protein
LQCNNENTAVMNDDNNELIWSTENLVMFGMWLVNKGDHGYGLLCIHGSCLGLKIGTLLKLTWEDFIEFNGQVKGNLEIYDEKKSKGQTINLSNFVMRYTEWAYANDFHDENRTIESPIYINCKTGKLLTTSSLNRELNKLYQEFRLEVYSQTYLDIKLRELKTNSFEIAWARDMVVKYNCTKKVFITISKYMGHRTVNDTIKLLEIEPNDDIKISFDLFDPSLKTEKEMNEIFLDKEKFKDYLFSQKIALTTREFEKYRDKSGDYDIRDKSSWHNL